MNNFEYPPLLAGERKIRLLTLEPFDPDRNILRDLTCNLSEGEDIEKCAGRYEALSYTWGDPSDLVMIHCGRQWHFVGRNLYQALEKLRHRDRRRVVWVDALCINQSDEAEKSHQIGLMPDIYRNCSETIMWLGEGDHEAWVAWVIFTRVRQLIFEGFQVSPRMQAELRENRSRFMSNRGLPFWDSEWKPAFTLLDHRYWDRMWIIQECLLGRNPMVYYGDSKMGLHEIQEIFKVMSQLGVATFFLDGRDGFFSLSALQMQQRFPANLFKLLQLCCLSQAGKPHDKIYALYGLTADPNEGGVGLPVDYQIAPSALLKRLAIAGLERSPTLQQLSLTSVAVNLDPPSELSSNLPSWAPNWIEAGRCHVLPDHGRRWLNTWQAFANPLPIAPKFRGDDHDELAVETAQAGVVVAVGKPLWASIDTKPKRVGVLVSAVDGALVHLTWINLAFKGMRWQPREDRDRRIEEFSLALTAGEGWEGGEQARQLRLRSFRHWLDFHEIQRWTSWLFLYKLHWLLHELLVMFVIMFRSFFFGVRRPHLTAPYVYTHGRRLCATDSGHLVLAPFGTKVGDKVALVNGLNWPAVLRPVNEDTMKFVGEACMPALARMTSEDFEEPVRKWLR